MKDWKSWKGTKQRSVLISIQESEMDSEEKENQPEAILLMRGHLDSLTSTKESLCHVKSLQSNSSKVVNLRRTKGLQSKDHIKNELFIPLTC